VYVCVCVCVCVSECVCMCVFECVCVRVCECVCIACVCIKLYGMQKCYAKVFQQDVPFIQTATKMNSHAQSHTHIHTRTRIHIHTHAHGVAMCRHGDEFGYGFDQELRETALASKCKLLGMLLVHVVIALWLAGVSIGHGPLLQGLL